MLDMVVNYKNLTYLQQCCFCFFLWRISKAICCLSRVQSNFYTSLFTDSCARKVCSFRQQCQSSIHGLVCSCPQYRCEGKLNKICGGDRVVYDSLCHLRRHECTKGRYIGVQEMSACRKGMSRLCNNTSLKVKCLTSFPLGLCAQSYNSVNIYGSLLFFIWLYIYRGPITTQSNW